MHIQMKTTLAIFLSTLFFTSAGGQYYFNDVVIQLAAAKQHQLLKTNNIRKVTASSFENDNQAADNFSLTQDINEDASTVTTKSSSPESGISITTSSYRGNRVIKTDDSSANVRSTITYTYDASGRISMIRTLTKDAFMGSVSEETHNWFYKENGIASYMLRVKDKTDTTRIEFTYDEKGNIAEETWKKRNTPIEHYYYYYDEAGHLTDIVRFNNKVKKMLPDFLYEYDAEGRIIKATQVPANSSNYIVWTYTYNSKGLKQQEIATNKQKQLIGRIEYKYQ
ncbi:MAG: hypothetical protein JWN76_1073 [Chitinophagaceae bacterium]|nr:hypothetical protein [Chitinophagaceae bacterium]